MTRLAPTTNFSSSFHFHAAFSDPFLARIARRRFLLFEALLWAFRSSAIPCGFLFSIITLRCAVFFLFAILLLFSDCLLSLFQLHLFPDLSFLHAGPEQLYLDCSLPFFLPLTFRCFSLSFSCFSFLLLVSHVVIRFFLFNIQSITSISFCSCCSWSIRSSVFWV